MPAHFEIHVNNMDVAKEFYGKVFGWTFTALPIGEDEIEYHVIDAPDIGPNFALTGGLLKRMDEPPASGGPIRGCTLTFEVADCDATYQTALKSGGAEALPPTDYPNIGRCAYCEDGQGNVFGFITPHSGNS